jgi:hypothetical protein
MCGILQRVKSPLTVLMELEQKALRLLCSNLIQPATRVDLAALLDPSVFADPLHRVIFEEICAAGEIPAAHLRALLPARITNRGFPDFDLSVFLEPNQASEAEIEQLFSSVLTLVELRHGEGASGTEN